MSDDILTTERILDVAEEVLRRFGPAKATVIDVARALGVSHGSVYRHFASKAALRDAVTRRWLARMSAPLATIVNEDASAQQKLRRWLDQLIATKRRQAFEDPELFATYTTLAAEAREVVKEHVDLLAGQIAQIIATGVTQGEFTVSDPIATGQAVFDATSLFHHPAHTAEWTDAGIDIAFEHVWELVLWGLGIHQISV